MSTEQYQCHDLFSVTRVFSPLLCLGWTSIWLYCHLRRGRDHLFYETLPHSNAHFFHIHNILYVLCIYTPVHYTKQCTVSLHSYFAFVTVFRLYRLWYGKKQEQQPQTDLPEDIRMTCTQFTKYHKDQCFHDIVKKRRWEHIVLLIAARPEVDEKMSHDVWRNKSCSQQLAYHNTLKKSIL